MPTDITLLDLLVFIWFFACWLGISAISIHYRNCDKLTLTSQSQSYRLQWMTVMLERDNRMVDVGLVGHLIRNVAFFASTSILILASLIALLSVIEKAIIVVADIPFSHPVSASFWKLKVLVLVVVFIYAFFKFVWSLRQYNSTVMMMGAAPTEFKDKQDLKKYAANISQVLHRAARHFNEGMRSFEYSLAFIAWFISPWLFFWSTMIVTLVIYRREFASGTLKAMSDKKHPVLKPLSHNHETSNRPL